MPFLSTIHIAHAAGALGAKLGLLRDMVATAVLRRVGATHIVVAEQAGRVLTQRLARASPAQRIRVVYNGVCETASGQDPAARNEVRAEWGIGSEEVMIGCVGRLEPQKNPLFLLDVLGALRRNGAPIRLVWIGDGPLREALMRKAVALGLKDAVVADGWRSDARYRMNGLDIFVLPSRFEGLPLALLESMCAGLPSCVSDVDGMPEAVTHGVNGYVCALDDLNDWTQHLSRLAGDREARCRMGQRARELAETRFSIRRMAEETLAVYEVVLSDCSIESGRDPR
jgi:glycosyltransferase involved in cell wall biosynthesis